MKISDARAKVISKKIAAEAIRRGVVSLKGGEMQLAALVTKIFEDDQATVESIDAEARELVSRQRSLPPPGTAEYNAAFQQARRTIAIRRGFPL